ncbi:MAG TPA: hypothetical protein VGJ14_08470 [Sporichthyaceae bacterium]|jgi:hypothetical protein
MKRMGAFARSIALSGAVLGCAACGGGSAGLPAPPGSPAASADPALPQPDWHWESFRNVELAVPAGWAHGTGDVAAAQWCISDSTYAAPYVIRPGLEAEQACPMASPEPVDPANLVAKAGSFVSFADVSSPSSSGAKDGLVGDRLTRAEGSVLVRVQAEQAVREKIVGSIRRITVDAAGCPVSDPISTDPGARPSPAVAVATVKDVTKVVACRYSLIGPALGSSSTAAPTAAPGSVTEAATLLSSVAVQGAVAADAVKAMGDASPGGGPNSEQNCPNQAGRGTEAIVLHIVSASGSSEVYLRYGGCNSLDDGLVPRVLTRRAVGPFVTGANMIPEYSDALAGILDDPDAPATSGDASGTGY